MALKDTSYIGDELSYAITVTNNGPDEAGDVVVTDMTFPATWRLYPHRLTALGPDHQLFRRRASFRIKHGNPPSDLVRRVWFE